MFAEKMVELGSRRSTIREIFEFGNRRAAQVGRENIFDFSLGNPNVPAPETVSDTIVRLVREEDAAALHGYTSAQGDAEVRNRIAESVNRAHGTHFTGDNLTPKTKAVVINSPNNPSGVVYSEETIVRLVKLLKERSQEYGHPIYLISDEPYREIAFDGVQVPYLTKYYDNTFVCYSYSKSLSMPGERIGYVLVPDEMEGAREAYAAVCGAGRV